MGYFCFIYTLSYLGKSTNIKNKFEGCLGLPTGHSYTSQPTSPLPASVTATNHLPSCVHHALVIMSLAHLISSACHTLASVSFYALRPHSPSLIAPPLPVGTIALFLFPQARCKTT